MKHQSYNAKSTLEKQLSYINGAYVANQSGETFTTRYPGDEHVICEVEVAGQPEIDAAVAAASEAYEAWSNTPAVERGNILRRAAALLRERNQMLAELETLDTGKPIAETSAVDIISGAEVIEFFAGAAQSIQGHHIDLPPEAFAIMRREPIGVCAGIGAWNYPMQIAMWKSGPALACGNTMVYKPAEQTPLTANLLAEIYTEAGLPPGVFNVVQGARDTGSALISHPGVAKVTLTGSVETGKIVMAHSAQDLKKVTLELGGKSPVIIFDDANLDNAINGALAANFYSSGQVCSNGTRVFVHENIYEEFIKRIAERTSAIKLGDPFDPETQMGPLVTREHFEKVVSYMQAGRDSSARHICGGDTPTALADGCYVTPAIFADCTDDMSIVTDEVFGPLMSVLSF
ncbi:MAG: betaine-aldehyde dehydrogenase, partial [Polaribacter sp.]